MVRGQTWLVVAVGLALLAAACGESGTVSNEAGPDDAPRSEWGPLAVVAAGSGSDDALIEGVLQVNENCVLLEERGETVLLVWPSEHVTWDAEAGVVSLTVRDRSMVELGDGDSVRMSGGGSSLAEGGLPADEFLASTDWVAAPSLDCVIDTRWFVGDEASVISPPPATAAVEAGWTRLPDPPISGRSDPIVALVDDRLIVAGGWNFLCPPAANCVVPDEAPHADGAAYDFEAGEWVPIAEAPVGIRTAGSAVIGSDLYALSQCDPGPNCPAGRSMLRYRSQADEWDSLPAPADRGFLHLMAFEDGLVAYAGSDEAGEWPDYRFIPTEDRWVPLPDDPLPAVYDRQLVDYNGQLLAFGTPGNAATKTKLAAAFDPTTGTWTELAESGTHGFQVWRSGQLLYLNPHFGNRAEGGVFDPTTNTWTSLPDTPTAESWRNDMAGIFSEDQAIYEYASGWVLNSENHEWLEVTPRPTTHQVYDETVAAAGRRLIVFGGCCWTGSDGQFLNETWVWTPPRSS